MLLLGRHFIFSPVVAPNVAFHKSLPKGRRVPVDPYYKHIYVNVASNSTITCVADEVIVIKVVFLPNGPETWTGQSTLTEVL